MFLYMDKKPALEHKGYSHFWGSYGIGHSIAELCTGLKAKVYSFSRSETGTDVADASLVKEALEKVYLIEKKIDFVINTAGILLKIPLMTMKYDDILNLIRCKLFGSDKCGEGIILIFSEVSWRFITIYFQFIYTRQSDVYA